MKNPFNRSRSPVENRTITRSSWGDPEEEAAHKGRRSIPSYSTYWRLYKTNPIVRASVVEVVRTLVSIPLLAEEYSAKDQTWLPLPPTDRLVMRLRRPSETIAPAVFYSRFWTHTVVTGNGYVQKMRGNSGEIIDWNGPVDARYIVPVRGTGFALGGYRFNPDKEIAGGVTAFDESSSVPVPARDIIHLPIDVDPDNPLRGLSPLASALDDIDLDFDITEFTRSVLTNGAVMDHALLTDDDVSETEIRRIERMWNRRHAGPQNAGGLVVVPKTSGTLTRMGLAIGPREMGLADLRKIIEARILMAMDVPPIVVGSVVGLENATYSNYMQARLAFHEENTDPNLWSACSVFGFALENEYPEHNGKLVRLRPDLSRVMALLEWEDRRRRLAIAEFEGSLATQTESRASVDRPPLPNGDWYKINLGSQRIDPAQSPVASDIQQTPTDAASEARHAIRTALRLRDSNALTVAIASYAGVLGCPGDAVVALTQNVIADAPSTGSVGERVTALLRETEFATAAVVAERN